MSDPAKHHPSRPTPIRVPPGPNREPEITAQPRPLTDELAPPDGGEAGLSVDPEDLALRYLSEATQQGEAPMRSVLESGLSIVSGPETDDVLTPPNFEHENTLWEQTVDLVTQTQNSASELRAPPLVEEEADPIERALEEQDEQRAMETSMHEVVLLDDNREDEDEANPRAPEIDSEGVVPRSPLIPSLEFSREPPAAKSGDKANGSPAANTKERPAANSRSDRAILRRAARSMLQATARMLRAFARLGQKAS